MATEAQMLEVKNANLASNEAHRQMHIAYGHYERAYRADPTSDLTKSLFAEVNRLDDAWFASIDACHQLEVLYGIDDD